MEKKEKDFLAVGKIVNTHGIRGELRVIPMTSDVSGLITCFTLDQGGRKASGIQGNSGSVS